MKLTLTAKLKLEVTEEQFAALRKSQLAYRDALNFASEYAFASKVFDRIQLKGVLARDKETLRAHFTDGLQRHTPGRSHLQGALEEGEKELQRKGTRKTKNGGKRPRSIRRRLSVIGRRERRLTLDVNHGLAKSMVAANPRSLIDIEKLTGIHERTRGMLAGKRRRNSARPIAKKVSGPLPSLRLYSSIRLALQVAWWWWCRLTILPRRA